MSVITLVVTLAVIGLIVWLLVTYVPMPDPIKKLIVIAAVVICILWVLRAMGLFDGVHDLSVPRVN